MILAEEKLEAVIVKEIMNYLKARPNSLTFKTHGGVYQARGIPDIYHLERGASFWIEVKRPRLGKLTDIQAATIARLNEAGAYAFAATGVDEVRHAIEFRFSR